MKAKYTIKVPGRMISPLSFDSDENVYFSTPDTFYRVSNGCVEEISGGKPTRQVTAYMMEWLNQLVMWPPLAVSGNSIFLPGTREDHRSTLSLIDPKQGPLWNYCSSGHGVGVVPCSLGGCFFLNELGTENGQQYSVEKIDRFGNKEWEKRYIGQPFHTFGPKGGNDRILFFHGNDWARDHYVMRLTQLDADGKETCIDEFTQSRTFLPLWTKGGSFLLVSIKSDAKTSLYEIRKYDQDPETGYYFSGKWLFDDMFYVGDWRVSPSGNYLCHTGGNTASIGNWSSIISLFSLNEHSDRKDIFIERETPVDLVCTPHYTVPLVTDSGVVLSAWHCQKSNLIFLTDFSVPEIPTHQIRNSSKTTLLMEEHSSKLYLMETSGGYVYLSVFDKW